MSSDVTSARERITTHLAESRAQLRQLLDIDHDESRAAGAVFPRSRTMRALTRHPALAIAVVAAAGVLVVRPEFAVRFARLIPLGAIGRTLMLRYLTQTKL
jgi:hypothetical protein